MNHSEKRYSLSMSPPLHDALLKIEWAKKHILNLNIEINKFIDSHTHTAYVERDPDGLGDLLKVRQDYATPSGISLVLGDVLHNLHAALDIAINDVEALTRGSMTKYTKFPVRETREEFEAAINGGFREKIPFEILNFLLIDVQPYKGGYGEPLWHLHALDIEDKHRILLTTTHLTFVQGIRIQLDNGIERDIGDWLIVPGHIAKHCIDGNRNVKVTQQGQPTFNVKFGDGLPFQGNPIIPTCHQLAQFVSDVVEQMAHIMRVLIKYGQLT